MEAELKCSLKKHSEIKAVIFCKECNKYMCNKCRQLHSELFDGHQLLSLAQISKNSFTGICKEDNHSLELEYFCKTHNLLCCERCISKFKKGKHSACNICVLTDIKNEKQRLLKDNIKCLEKIGKDLNDKIGELKNMIDKVEGEKEELKTKIQKIFTQIKNAINEREDQLLLYVDKKFKKYYLKNEFKEGNDIKKKIKENLDKSNLVNKEWNNKKLNLLINDCIDIENSVSKLKEFEKKLINLNSNNIKIKFFPNDYDVNLLMNSLKNFGKISHKEYKYAFRECPENIENNKKYLVSGIDNNILTKVGNNCWTGIISKNPLEKNKVHIWKINILESHKDSNSIVIGLAPENFDINKSSYTDCGWYLCCCCGDIFAGGKHYTTKDKNNKFNLKSKVITLTMNINTNTLTYSIDSDKPVPICNNIPNNKKLYPTVFLRYKDDKVIVSDNNWKAINLKQKIKEDKKKENNNQIGLKANIKKEQKDEKEGIKEPIIGRGLGRGRGLPLRFFGRRPGFRNRIGIRIGIRGLRRRR